MHLFYWTANKRNANVFIYLMSRATMDVPSLRRHCFDCMASYCHAGNFRNIAIGLLFIVVKNISILFFPRPETPITNSNMLHFNQANIVHDFDCLP